MPWPHASSRLALILRRWRGRFGITAPQVAIRPHRPWYARSFVLVAALLGVAMLVWLIDPAERLATMSHAEEIATLQKTNAALEEEVERLRGQLAARENDLQIEQAAQRSLTDKHKALMEENARLKEELAVLQRLAEKSSRKR